LVSLVLILREAGAGMGTVHKFMAQSSLERFEETPGGLELLHRARRGLCDGQWTDDYVSAIGQHPLSRPDPWPVEQIAAFLEVHTLLLTGSVAEALIGVGRRPRRDADREENAAALARLPHPFRAEVDLEQNNRQGDGTLFWDCPIPLTLWTGLIGYQPDGSTHPLPLQFHIPPGQAVLEIGSSQPSRTLAHLINATGNVARWPYGCRQIRLFVNLDPETFLGARLGKAVRDAEKAKA
jgi:hypothetical protein